MAIFDRTHCYWFDRSHFRLGKSRNATCTLFLGRESVRNVIQDAAKLALRGVAPTHHTARSNLE